MNEDRFILEIKRVVGDKETTHTRMEIDADRIRPVCAAGLGLAAPRGRKPKRDASDTAERIPSKSSK